MNGIPSGLNDQGRGDWLARRHAAQTGRERADVDQDWPSGCDCGVHALCLRHRREQERIAADLAANAASAAVLV